ncbi:unnamed protein product [Parnassius apollo]|uniref:(apollo) hypothetical protein n=1 Tax=Parnassius apollo TaxID=110799 RepID=A0A8S3XV12_PARAO|nr:unnamed protein product [Parnassius apollo]
MNEKALNDLEIACALEEIFGLPDDPDVSDDNLESDEEDVQYSTVKLQRILESLDEPHDGILAPTPDPPDSLISNISNASVENQPSPSPQPTNSDRLRRARIIQNAPSTSGTQQTLRRQPQSPVANTNSDSETDDSDGEEETWKKTMWTTDRPSPSVYDEIPMEPAIMFSSRTRPVTVFEKFFTDEVYDLIIYQTNLYAEQRKDEGWTQLDKKELKAFVGIFIIMGYNILPSIDFYWSSDPGFRVDEIAETMTVKRFKKILRNLHVNDNTQIPDKTSENYDKLYKIRPLLDLITQACQKNAKDSSSQSIDESMILFKGRSSMKQYMPLKPIKRGYKVWCRCDSKTGYLYEFYIYTGKSKTGTEEGLGSKVVKMLTEKLINKALEEYHIIITFDNFFCDYTLMQYLYENGIYATGTVRRHRKHLPVLVKTNQKLAKGQYKWRVKGNVSFLVWQDTKEVLLLSNAFHPKVGKTTVLRTQKDGTKQEINCPLAIKEYTKRMGGVDHFDQIKSTYSVGRRSRRWWVRIFFFLLDTSITNAYLLYCQNKNATKLSNLEFRVSVARGLISGFSSRKRRSGSLVNYICRKKIASENRQKAVHVVAEEVRFTNVGDHMPVESPSYKRCRMCSTKEKDKRSKVICEKCKVPLCITPCFTAFHRKG